MQQILDRRTILLASFCLSLAFCSRTVLADAPRASGALGAESPSVADIFIGELEKRIIRNYYERHLHEWQQSAEAHNWKKKNKRKSLPPGLAKKGKLPPGIAKQLVRNGQLPSGLEHHPLPGDLLAQLPPLQPSYRYVIADNRVLLVQAASNLILDVLQVAAIELLE